MQIRFRQTNIVTSAVPQRSLRLISTLACSSISKGTTSKSSKGLPISKELPISKDLPVSKDLPIIKRYSIGSSRSISTRSFHQSHHPEKPPSPFRGPRISREQQETRPKLHDTPMLSITTICHKSSDTSHPLLIVQNNNGSRYLFGKIPEGSQRSINESKFKLGKLEGVFITGALTSWAEIGGLPGLFLTISDATKKGIDLFVNSSKIASFVIASWRYFVFRKGVSINVKQASEDTSIEIDGQVVKTIKIMPKLPSTQPTIDKDRSNSLLKPLQQIASAMFPLDTSQVNTMDPDSYKSDPNEFDIHTHVKLPQLSHLESVEAQPSANYLIRSLPTRGRFDARAAASLGVKPGILYRELSAGKSVLNKDGELVHSHQVLGESKHFEKILILDIPNISYYHNTIESDQWFVKDETSGEEDIGLVYHFIGDSIDLNMEEYSKFLNKFPPNCKHVLSHRSISDDTISYSRFSYNTFALKCIQNDQFNLPYSENYTPLETSESPRVFKLQTLQKFTVESSGTTYTDEFIKKHSWSAYFDESIGPLNLGHIDKEQIINSPPLSIGPVTNANSMKDHVQIVTLGTGSAIPSLQRNVVSSLVRIPYIDSGNIKFRSVLLDGGENTLAMMLRNYSHDNGAQLDQIFDELSLIYLSHLHADHHLGIVSVINEWFSRNADNDKKLYLVTPWQYNNFLSEWYQIEAAVNKNIKLDRLVYLSCQEFLKSQERAPQQKQLDIEEFQLNFDQGFTQSVQQEPLPPKNQPLINQLYHDLGIQVIKTCKANHCFWAYSVSITFNLNETETFQISYSGDTRPNPKFVTIGYGSDVLIHECSLGDDLIEEAIGRKHSTMVEAVKMSQLMNCPKVILTHFSARYSNRPHMFYDMDKLNSRAREMKKYLHNWRSYPNIFTYTNSLPIIADIQDVEICMAFDMMTLRYNNLGDQRTKYARIAKVYISESSVSKVEKDIKRQSEVSDSKRLERLSRLKKNNNKKRRVSSEEEKEDTEQSS